MNLNKYVILLPEYIEGFNSFDPKVPDNLTVNPYNRETNEQEYESFERGFFDYLLNM